MESCGFGKALDNDCHKTTFAWKQGFKDFSTLEKDLQDIWRSGLRETKSNGNVKTVCYHHEHMFGPLFILKNNKCCDVFKRPKKMVKVNISYLKSEQYNI